jgi:hypothetical protein
MIVDRTTLASAHESKMKNREGTRACSSKFAASGEVVHLTS